MFGREMRFPLDVLYPPFAPKVYRDTDDYVDELEKRLFKAAKYARQELHDNWEIREKNCANHSRTVKPIDITRPLYVFE
jgi:hypothetical protein